MKKRFTVMLDDDLIKEFKIAIIVRKDDVQELVTQMINSYLTQQEAARQDTNGKVEEFRMNIVDSPETALKAVIAKQEAKGKMVTPIPKGGSSGKKV